VAARIATPTSPSWREINVRKPPVADLGSKKIAKGMAPKRPQVCIRDYEQGDASSMARVFYASVHGLGPRRYAREQVMAWAPNPPNPATFHARAMDGRTTLIAIDASGELVAYGDLESDGHIDHLYCSPDAAGGGVASKLLDEIVGRAAARGTPRLYAEASELARGLFERQGFTVLGRRDFDLSGVPIHNYLVERLLI
jgi:putative acetyltransferase